MHKLQLSFALFTYTGYWKPTEWPTNSIKHWLYNVYSAFMILQLYLFTFCSFVDSAISKDLKTMSDKFCLFISVLGVCVKVANLFVQRRKIISVVDVLLKKNCVPRNEQEIRIQRKFDNYARKLTIYCEILNELSAWFATVPHIKTFIRTRTLPVSNWVPYSLSSGSLFMMSLIHQSLCLMVCANTSVAHETLIAGLLMQVGAQFEIFCHRARDLPFLLMEVEKNSTSAEDLKNRRRKILKDMIQHHLEIYKFAHSINSVFQYMIFLQFCISSTVLCLSVFKISSENPLTLDFAWSCCYLGAMLMQVYLYCWFGNEVTLKSKSVGDAIYDMDWTTLPVSVLKDLLIIMARSKKPIIMTSGHIVTLSTDSFVKIMKISYSSFNILKDTSSN